MIFQCISNQMVITQIRFIALSFYINIQLGVGGEMYLAGRFLILLFVIFCLPNLFQPNLCIRIE